MNLVTELNKASADLAEPVISAPFFVRGQLVEAQDVTHRSRDLGVTFATPRIDLDKVVHPRTEVPPLLNVPLAEIIDFLVETGERIKDPNNAIMQECIDRMCSTHILPREVVANQAVYAAHYLNKRTLMAEVEQNFPDPRALDTWVPKQDYTGRKSFVRAFAPRLIHVMPGNSPGVAVKSIAQGAMVKAVNLFKMSSSDPFTMVALLRTMAEIDPNHPIVQSMSAVYWRGGDDSVEQILYRPQYFDKIVAWGGGDAINNVIQYLGPGIQLISFDPKTSISMIGSEGFESDAVIEEIAEAAAADVAVFNQEACLASRFILAEGDRAGIEKFCARLQDRLGVDRATASEVAHPLPAETREEIEVLRMMDDECKVWGKGDGRGLVILTSDPVDFHPSNKTANVVHVPSLDDAVRHVNVATQTIGIYPPARKAQLRDRLASAGAQRVVRLGSAAKHVMGGPHDAMFPLQRFVHWMSDEDA
jgi:acyl-CoA reductase LuxC